jgi:hypothetical protein
VVIFSGGGVMFTQICYMFRVFCISFLTPGSGHRGNRFNLIFAVISCLVILLTVPAAADPYFTNVTADANVSHQQCSDPFYGTPTLDWPIISMLGGAVAGNYDFAAMASNWLQCGAVCD